MVGLLFRTGVALSWPELARVCLQMFVPVSVGRWVWLGGDYRYTPWILKFYFFEQIIFGLGLISLVIFVSVRSETRRVNGGHLMLLFY